MNKPKSTWIEHTWSTFIAREEEPEEVQEGKNVLSSFQREKFIYFYYHVLDINCDNVISQVDFDTLNSRVRHYKNWSKNHPQYLTFKEVHMLFLEYFLVNAVRFVPKDNVEDAEFAAKDSISIDEWVDVWADIVGRARELRDLPIWLQYYPKTLFDTINISGSGIISKKELKLFYKAFLDGGKLGEELSEDLADKSYNAMTSNGDADLTYHIYKLSFLNFLMGKQPNGPGQFMFGTVERAAVKFDSFPIDYSVLNSLPEEIEVFTSSRFEEKSKRKSVLV